MIGTSILRRSWRQFSSNCSYLGDLDMFLSPHHCKVQTIDPYREHTTPRIRFLMGTFPYPQQFISSMDPCFSYVIYKNTCQQSSRFRYLYPFCAKPVLTNKSAVYLISFYVMLHPKWFQLFQPIGGVIPRPLSKARPKDHRIRNTMALMYFILYYC